MRSAGAALHLSPDPGTRKRAATELQQAATELCSYIRTDIAASLPPGAAVFRLVNTWLSTQLTGFTSTKVQKMTPEEVRASAPPRQHLACGHLPRRVRCHVFCTVVLAKPVTLSRIY